MSKTGLIYEIVCNLTGERYIGSTFEPTVAKRMVCHRQVRNACKSKQIIERNNYYYGLLETIQINTRDELHMCERKWFDSLECINKNKPFSSDAEKLAQQKEYKSTHREQAQDYNKTYYEQHKEHIKQQNKIYYHNKVKTNSAIY